MSVAKRHAPEHAGTSKYDQLVYGPSTLNRRFKQINQKTHAERKMSPRLERAASADDLDERPGRIALYGQQWF